MWDSKPVTIIIIIIAAGLAGGVPRVMGIFSSSHFDKRRWHAAVGQEAAVPIVNVAHYIWCVAERLHVSWKVESHYLRSQMHRRTEKWNKTDMLPEVTFKRAIGENNLLLSTAMPFILRIPYPCLRNQ